ncbi:hypothetical protein HMPREF3190_00588 [Umbribacter vaginalis]|nr:hypothetical protein HMPREF3190_00588 [Coriobacteriales bacterium DNF00809]
MDATHFDRPEKHETACWYAQREWMCLRHFVMFAYYVLGLAHSLYCVKHAWYVARSIHEHHMMQLMYAHEHESVYVLAQF